MFPSLSILLQELYPSYQLNLYRINRYSGCCRCLTMAIALCNCNEAQCRCICSQRREENFLTAMAQASLGSQTTCCHLSGEIPTELWNFSLLMQWCCCTCTTMSLKGKKKTLIIQIHLFFFFSFWTKRTDSLIVRQSWIPVWAQLSYNNLVGPW